MSATTYVEAERRDGLHKAYAFFGLFGSLYLVFAIPQIFYPKLMEGAPWDVVLSGHLLIASPLFISVFPFRKLWHARVLQARPIRIRDDGIVFPTTWSSRGDTVIPWSSIRAVGTDYDPSKSLRRFFWHVWIAANDGRLLERPYVAGTDGDQTIKESLSKLEVRLHLSDTRGILDAVGRIPATDAMVASAKLLAILSGPIAAIVILGLVGFGFVRSAYPLILASTLASTIVVTLPMWLWASHERELGRSVPGSGG